MSFLANSVTAALAVFCLAATSSAQEAVPTEILQRTFLIGIAGKPAGTAFTVDYNGALYLVTARHVVAGLPDINPTFQLLINDKWADFRAPKKLLPSSNDVDIAVFEGDNKLPNPYTVSLPSKEGGIRLGQQVWFIGYPFGDTAMMTRVQDARFPFIKRGVISAINASNPDAVVMYIDGFNNPGFSGGPVIHWDFNARAYRLIGVIMGFRTDTAKVLVNNQQVNSNILVNSGIIIAYNIQHVVEAIDRAKTPSKSTPPQ